MGAYDAIGSALAKANLGVAKGIGRQITFTHRSEASVTLDVEVLQEGILTSNENGIVTELRFMEVLIASGQTGFSAPSNDTEPIVAGDKAVHASRTYYAQDPIMKVDNGLTYRVRFVEPKRLAAGV